MNLSSIDTAVRFLRSSDKKNKFLLKISKNAGDTCHGQPIIRYYKNIPDSVLVFLTCEKYKNIHELDTNIDAIFTLPNEIDDKTRLKLWPVLKQNSDITAIIPAINPFRALYKSNDWCQDNIAKQYLYNAGVPTTIDNHLIIKVDDNDIKYASKVVGTIPKEKLIAIEYNSYSARRSWDLNKYVEFVNIANKHGYRCLSIAAAHEPKLQNTIDCRGCTWRQSVAIMSMVGNMIGCGSGLSVMASGARPSPMIYELNIPDNVTINNCGYAKSVNVKKPTPETVFDYIRSGYGN